MSRSWDITEVNYVVKNELEYNLKDNMYLYDNKIYSISEVRDFRDHTIAHCVNYYITFCVDYYITFVALDGSEKITLNIRVDDIFLDNCEDLDDISEEVLNQLYKIGLVFISDDLVNSEAFRTLYL